MFPLPTSVRWRGVILLFASAALGILASGSDEVVVSFLEPLEREVFQDSRDVTVRFVAETQEVMTGRSLLLKVQDFVVSAVSLPSETFSEHSIQMVALHNGLYELSVELDGSNHGSLAKTSFSVEIVAELFKVEDDVHDLEDFRDPKAALQDPLCEAQNLTGRRHQPRVFDTFIFNGEIDLLEVRLEELDPVVDIFVIVEGSRTFQGRPKELRLKQNSDRLTRFMHKIEYVVEDFSGLPPDADTWTKEQTQRDAIVRGLDAADAADLVIISDLDEIPKRDAVAVLRQCAGYVVPAFLEAHMHYYGFQFEFAERWWQGPKVAVRDMLSELVGAQTIRSQPPLGAHGTVFRDAAWHCSFFVDIKTGSVEPLFNKFRSYSHTEWLGRNASRFEYIQEMVAEGRDLFEDHYGYRSGGLHRVGAAQCGDLPVVVQQDLGRFRHWAPHCASLASVEEGAPSDAEHATDRRQPPTRASSDAGEAGGEGSAPADEIARELGVEHPAHSWIELVGAAAYYGLQVEVMVHLRDGYGNVLDEAALWRAQGGGGEPGTMLTTFNDSIVGAEMGCAPELSTCYLCFVPHVNEGEGGVRASVQIGGHEIRNSPLEIPLLPIWDIGIHGGCVRPGVSRSVSICRDIVTIGQRLSEIPDCYGRSEGRGMFGGRWGGMEGSGVCKHVENLYLGGEVCLHNNAVYAFGGEEAERALEVGGHWWGLPTEGGAIIPIKYVAETFAEWVEANEADVDDGAVPVMLVPEGPLTHFGHMLTDTVLPLYATTLVDDGIGGEGDRRRVILFPRMGNSCPIKGGAVASRRFWDLFHALTTNPLEDIQLLSDVAVMGVPQCFRRLVIGLEQDFRAGYAMTDRRTTGSALPRVPETVTVWTLDGATRSVTSTNLLAVPFRELFPAVARRLVRVLLPSSAHLWQWRRQGSDDEAQLTGTLVDRGDRKINNEVLLAAAAEAGISCSLVRWEGKTLREQLAVATESHLLAGVYGAGLMKSVFLREGSVMLMVLPYCLANATDFWEISQDFRLRHYTWRCEVPSCSSCPPGASCEVPDCGNHPPPSAMVLGGMEGGSLLQDTSVDPGDAAKLLQHAAAALRAARTDGPQSACAVNGDREVVCSHSLGPREEAE